MKSLKLGSIIALTLLLSNPSFARRRPIDFPIHWNHSFRSIIKEAVPFEAIFEDGDNTIQLHFYENVDGFNIQITDSKGSKIFNETFNASKNEIKTIPLTNIENGEYTIVVRDDSKFAIGKFIL